MSTGALYSDRFQTPLGQVVMLVDDVGVLRRLSFLEARLEDEIAARVLADEARHAAHVVADPRPVEQAREALEEFLAGRRWELEIPFEARGTGFQKLVWERLRNIPYGETRTYGEIAVAIGSPSSSRAVGRAAATNPIAIATPCHRVLGAHGELTGFFGGVQVKRALLDLEQRYLEDFPTEGGPDDEQRVPPPRKLGEGLRISDPRRSSP